jgi:hypothetical protein
MGTTTGTKGWGEDRGTLAYWLRLYGFNAKDERRIVDAQRNGQDPREWFPGRGNDLDKAFEGWGEVLYDC